MDSKSLGEHQRQRCESLQRCSNGTSGSSNPHLTPAAAPAAAPTAAPAAAQRMPFQQPPPSDSLSEKTLLKPELVGRCICLLNMLLDWPSPRTAVTERFVRVGIRAGYRW